MLRWQCPVSSLSSECHKATACSLLMLHFSWNNHTVFQTPKGTPKLENTSLPLPQLSPHASPPSPCSPANQPTRHPLLPCTHPLVSCPYLGRDVLSSVLGRGRGRALSWHKGGRRRSSEHSQLFLNKDMSGIQAPLSLKSLSFHSTSLEHTLMSTHSFSEVIRVFHRSTLAALCIWQWGKRSSVFF